MPLWKKKKPKKKSANKPKPKPKQGLPPIPAKPKFEPKPFVPPKIPEYFTPPAMPTRPPEKKPASKRQAVDVENEFLKTFKSLTYRHRGWDIWNDFIVMAACALSNPVDKSHYEEREARYLRIIKKYNKDEQNKFPTLFAHTVMALEFNPEQDFLGKLYTRLGLQDEGRKQHFTPYSICQAMADITMTDIVKQVRENGYITLNDPCCGAGATLIAGINCAKRRLGEACLNFQNHVLVTAQDIDETVALMCYIQLSLLGMAGYIKVGNTFSEPMISNDSLENYWFTPMYFSDVWAMRRAVHQMEELEGEAEYRAKIKNINSELAVYKSELEKVEAKYKTSANSLEALSAKQSALKGQLEALNKRHSQEVEMLEKARKAQQQFADEADSVRAKLESLKNSSSDTTEEQEKLAKQLADAEESMQKAANSANFYQKQLNNTERDQEKLGQELEQTGKYLAEAESDFYKCAKSIDKYGNEAKDAGDASRKLGESSMDAINQLAGVLASAGVAKSVAEIASALLECVKAFGEFESQMSAVQAISGASGAQMAELTEKAKYMGATTSFTATEAGQALEYMAMAGWKTNEMMDGLEGIMHLAAASGEDLGATSDIVTDALTAFELTASDSARFADVLAAASSNANTNVGMMGETFKYAAPVAGSLGYSIEDTALAIGLMANAGIKGTQAGTALRSAFSRLASDAGATETQLGALGVLTEKLGVQFYNIDGSTRALNDVLVDSRAAWAGLSAEEQIFYGKTIAGTEAMSGWLALMNAGEADFQKLSLAISNSSGAAKEMSEIKLDNLSGQMTLLDSAADGLKIAIGEQLAPALSDLAEAGTDALTWATEFTNENKLVGPAIVGTTTAVGALVAGVTLYTYKAELAAAKTALLSAVMNANPAVFLVSAMAGLAVAIGAYVAAADDADEKTRDFTDSLKDSKDAYEDLNDSMADQSRNNRAMASSLLDLLRVEEKSALQKDQIEQKVAKLNEAVPGLNLAYDREKDALIGVTEAELESMLAREEAQAQYEAQVSRLNELSTERAEIESRLKDARLALNEAEVAGTGNTRELQNTINELTAAQEENERQTAALEEASSAYGEAQAQAAAKSQEAQTRIQELTNQMAALDEAHQKSMEAARANLERQMGLFADLDTSVDVSINDMIESLKRQTEYMDSYAYVSLDLIVQGFVQSRGDNTV